MNELKEAVKEFVQDKSPENESSPFTEEENIDNKIIENENNDEKEGK
jgi:hypothetical protein